MTAVALKSFLINKNQDCSSVDSFIQLTLGSNPFLITALKADCIDANITRLDLWYKLNYDVPVASASPAPGCVFTTGLTNGNLLDLRILFNQPISTGSLVSGSISVDGVSLPVSRYTASPYFLDVNLANYALPGYHYLYLDRTKINLASSNSVSNSYYSDYNVYGQSVAGKIASPKVKQAIKGITKTVVIRARSSNLADASVQSYIRTNEIGSEHIVAQASCIDPRGIHETYLVHILRQEPQIESSSPTSDSLLPLVLAPGKVSFTYTTPLDGGQVTTQSGLFTVFSGYNSYSNISPSLISLSSDRKTVTIDTSSIFTEKRFYSILSNPGLRSNIGAAKTSPDMWSIYVDDYMTGGGSSGPGVALSGVDQSTFGAHTGDTSIHFTTGSIDHTRIQNIGVNTHAQIDSFMVRTTGNYSYLSGLFTGLTGRLIYKDLSSAQFLSGELGSAIAATDPSSFIRKNESEQGDLAGIAYTNILVGVVNAHLADTANPHSTTAAQVGAPTIAQFTGHTGDNSIHFTQGSISITSSQVSDFNEAAQDAVGSILLGLSGVDASYNDASNSITFGLSGWLYTGITGHIGNTGVHFTQAQISIPYTQINNFSAGVNTYAPTIAQFTGHTGDAGIHFTQSSISITASQVSDFGGALIDYLEHQPGLVPQSGISLDISDSRFIVVGLSGWLYSGITGHIGNFSNPHNITAAQIGAAATGSYAFLSGQFTGHTGNTAIHFTQAQISIPSTQISDWTEAVQDVVGAAGFVQYGNGLSGTYSDAGNSFTLSGVFATSTVYGIAKFDATRFSIATGFLSLPSYITSVSGLSDASIASLKSGDFLMARNTTGQWTNLSITGKGADTVIYDYNARQVIISGATGLSPALNLSDLTSGYAATTNLRVRYLIDDFAPLNGGVWTTASAGGGSAYQYNPQYAAVLRTNDAYGVAIASNGAATGLTGAAILYHSNAGAYLSDNTTFYFRTLLSTTGTVNYRFGLFNAVPSNASGIPADGTYFEYDSRSGTMLWSVTASGSARTMKPTFLTGSTTTWQWTAIESTSTGVRFYQADPGGSTRLLTTHDGTTKPAIANRAMRAFTQCQGNGSQFAGIYIDKYAYPIYYDNLPSGIST